MRAEDRAERGATQRVGQPQTVEATRRWQELYLELRKEQFRQLARVHAVTEDTLSEITSEGLRSRWPLPSR